MKPYELQIAMAEQRIRHGELKTPHELFAFLDDFNYFISKEATMYFACFVSQQFGIHEMVVVTYIRKMLMDKVKVLDANGKFKTAQDIFTYLDNVGFFFRDFDGRARCLHDTEQCK